MFCVHMCLCDSHSVMSLCDPLDIQSTEFSRPEYSSGQPFPSPRDLPSQGSKPSLPYCRQILYQLSQQRSPRSPRILEWAASPFSSRFSQPKDFIYRVSSGFIQPFCINANPKQQSKWQQDHTYQKKEYLLRIGF